MSDKIYRRLKLQICCPIHVPALFPQTPEYVCIGVDKMSNSLCFHVIFDTKLPVVLSYYKIHLDLLEKKICILIWAGFKILEVKKLFSS